MRFTNWMQGLTLFAALACSSAEPVVGPAEASTPPAAEQPTEAVPAAELADATTGKEDDAMHGRPEVRYYLLSDV